MSRHTTTCQWCGEDSLSARGHMLHLHDVHPWSIGRGRTMSPTWTCPACAHPDNVAAAVECRNCGHVHRERREHLRIMRFVLCRRDGTPTDPAGLFETREAWRAAVREEPDLILDVDALRSFQPDGTSAIWVEPAATVPA